MANRRDHTFRSMLEPQSESDFNVHYDARIQIRNRGGPGWLQLVNWDVIIILCHSEYPQGVRSRDVVRIQRKAPKKDVSNVKMVYYLHCQWLTNWINSHAMDHEYIMWRWWDAMSASRIWIWWWVDKLIIGMRLRWRYKLYFFHCLFWFHLFGARCASNREIVTVVKGLSSKSNRDSARSDQRGLSLRYMCFIWMLISFYSCTLMNSTWIDRSKSRGTLRLCGAIIGTATQRRFVFGLLRFCWHSYSGFCTSSSAHIIIYGLCLLTKTKVYNFSIVLDRLFFTDWAHWLQFVGVVIRVFWSALMSISWCTTSCWSIGQVEAERNWNESKMITPMFRGLTGLHWPISLVLLRWTCSLLRTGRDFSNYGTSFFPKTFFHFSIWISWKRSPAANQRNTLFWGESHPIETYTTANLIWVTKWRFVIFIVSCSIWDVCHRKPTHDLLSRRALRKTGKWIYYIVVILLYSACQNLQNIEKYGINIRLYVGKDLESTTILGTHDILRLGYCISSNLVSWILLFLNIILWETMFDRISRHKENVKTLSNLIIQNTYSEYIVLDYVDNVLSWLALEEFVKRKGMMLFSALETPLFSLFMLFLLSWTSSILCVFIIFKIHGETPKIYSLFSSGTLATWFYLALLSSFQVGRMLWCGHHFHQESIKQDHGINLW